jgi:hypothetical protein
MKEMFERWIPAYVSILGVCILALVLNANAAAGFNNKMTPNQMMISKNTYNASEDEPNSKEKEEVLQVIKKELIKDKLIENGIYFEIKLSNKDLFINDIPQKAALFKKYKGLYENLSGKILEKEISFPIFNTDEEFDRQINESEKIKKIEKQHKEDLVKLKEKYKEKERKLREKLENLDEEMKKDEERLKIRIKENVKSKKKSLRRLKIIKKELLKDKLIDDESNFKLKLVTSGSLYINEVKQTKRFFKKYRKLLETLYERGIEGTFKIIVAD